MVTRPRSCGTCAPPDYTDCAFLITSMTWSHVMTGMVDTILESLKDAGRVFGKGTTDECKRVVRAFVETLTLDGQTQTGVLRIKKLPMPANGTGSSSFESLGGVGFEPTTFGL